MSSPAGDMLGIGHSSRGSGRLSWSGPSAKAHAAIPSRPIQDQGLMRYLILADLHSNIEALDSLLEVVSHEQFDHFLILGDLVGYNASPKEVLERVRKLEPQTILRGNHDK